jgi:hypothetical protein
VHSILLALSAKSEDCFGLCLWKAGMALPKRTPGEIPSEVRRSDGDDVDDFAARRVARIGCDRICRRRRISPVTVRVQYEYIRIATSKQSISPHIL